MKNSNLVGVIAAIATPVTADGIPNADKLTALAKFLLSNGCNALNILGTTGEATSFAAKQRMALMSSAVQAGLPLDRLMVGTGAASVDDAVRLTTHAATLGFAGALVLPPFYYKAVSDIGIMNYFRRIVTALGSSKLPLFLYNFPVMTGLPYTPALVRKLIDTFGSERIVGLKDSSGDLPYTRQIARENPGFKVFPSNESTLLEAGSGIFAGCISASANINSALCAKAFLGDVDAHGRAIAVRKLFSDFPLIPGIKTLLAHIHNDRALRATKPPLVPLEGSQASELVRRYQAVMEI